jgi:predicted lipid carrier protein YhbT
MIYCFGAVTAKVKVQAHLPRDYLLLGAYCTHTLLSVITNRATDGDKFFFTRTQCLREDVEYSSPIRRAFCDCLSMGLDSKLRAALRSLRSVYRTCARARSLDLLEVLSPWQLACAAQSSEISVQRLVSADSAQ